MRLGWTRSHPELTPSADDVQAMVAAGLPGARGVRFASAEGGFANTNLKIDLDRAPHRVLLRLYQRDAAQAAKEAALAERLAGTVPVARFLHIGRHARYSFALVEWIEGTRLEVDLTTMDAVGREAAGRSAGAALGGIHRVGFDAVGFLDAALTVAMPVDAGPAFFLAFLRGSFIDGQAHRLLGNDLARAAMAYAQAHADMQWPGPPCLIHSDYNGSNILMRGTEVAAVVDWEFAMSARPDADFGNLLRNHPDEAFLGGIVAGYEAQGHAMPVNWRVLARNSDLIAWADMLSRPGIHPSVVESAKRAIEETVGA